ncbi:MAG: cytochrome c oxidase accessory protein CcoG [Luminiphilus sp.]|nr:cytochrome c oxidase accessory protein CcoG [Luminiphilus sp.]
MNSQHDQVIAVDAAVPAEVSELDKRQRREKIYTRAIEGYFQRLRLYTGWPLLLGYFLLPWLNLDGRQAVLFDLPERKFHILSVTFWPQDLVLLAFILIIAAFTLFAVTALWGRLWCGYTCPQTVWTAIFMYIEQRFEGSRNQRIKLDQEPLSWEKLRKKTLKHSGWGFVAALTGVTFVSYFVPIRQLLPELLSLSADLTAMSFVLLFTVATYLNAGYLREKVCTDMCPYARFQSVMFDKNTLVVTYDTKRGEPRGSRKRFTTKDPHQGDCIDCELCVQVCPTGIDIRAGLQHECIGCALCIDACDSIMEKMGSPKGLVSYTSENALAGQKSTGIPLKTLGYIAALAVMLALFSTTLLTRSLVELSVSRDRGQLFLPAPNGLIDNVYELHLTNRGALTDRYRIEVEGMTEFSILGGDAIMIPSGELLEVGIRLRADPNSLPSSGTQILFRAVSNNDESVIAEAESRFIRPTL